MERFHIQLEGDVGDDSFRVDAAQELIRRHEAEYEIIAQRFARGEEMAKLRGTIAHLERALRDAHERNPDGIHVPLYKEQTEGIIHGLEERRRANRR